MRIPLANLLVRSPLPQIGVLMDAVDECVAQVPPLIDCLTAGDTAGLERIAREVSVLEGLADEAKNALRDKMPVRLFLPVDRRDVLRLIRQIDAVANCAEDVGVLLTLRSYEVPEELAPLLRELVEAVMVTVAKASDLVGMMDDLIGAGFSGKAAEAAMAKADEIGRLEHEADKLQDRCAKALFRAEDAMSPVSIFMWTKVLNKIGNIANHAENVGDQFRLFVAAS
ncbi:MAG: TIGR00153 family protein [Myxococcales bacterium]|nr:TIGR00153 family protein [Deltaproteobacteria bacterium]NNE16942.1 TIGR00153 family protein [Myxococcales bacterium]